MESLIVHINDTSITNKKAVSSFFRSLKDGKYEVVAKRINKRSLNQNRYYFGCVVAMIKERMIELGNDVDSQLVHDFLKDRFNSKELFNQDGVIIGAIGDTTTKLSKTEFEQYLEKVKRFAAEVLDIIIPDPNEQTAMFSEPVIVEYVPNDNITLCH